jgi:Ergosterol biosynthesis ERG4/ERG24 family
LPATTILPAIGCKLLVSGWWGIGRKINYTGELGVYLSFALCAGVSHWQPFLVPLSLLSLLMQRDARDDKSAAPSTVRSGRSTVAPDVSDDPVLLLIAGRLVPF